MQVSAKAKKIAAKVINDILARSRKILGHGVDDLRNECVMTTFILEFERDAENLTSTRELKLIAKIRFQQAVSNYLSSVEEKDEESEIVEE
jgi:hypothetical protein